MRDRNRDQCYYVEGNAIEDSLRERDIGVREWRQACCFWGGDRDRYPYVRAPWCLQA